MPYKTCRHLLENGTVCQSPALKTRGYCYFHLEFRLRRLKMARARARGERWWLDLPAIEDMRSCQAAAVRVFEALAARLLDPAEAKPLLSWLRLLSANFKARKAWDSPSDYAANGAAESAPSHLSLAKHGLPSDLDLDADPLEAFPMPESPAPAANSATRIAKSALQAARTPAPGMLYQLTADDVELIEVEEREGELARLKRAAELERNRRRRERRLERARYEELARTLNVQLAAKKLLADHERAGTRLPDFDPARTVAEARSAEFRAAAARSAQAMLAQGSTPDGHAAAKKPPSPAPNAPETGRNFSHAATGTVDTKSAASENHDSAASAPAAKTVTLMK